MLRVWLPRVRVLVPWCGCAACEQQRPTVHKHRALNCT